MWKYNPFTKKLDIVSTTEATVVDLAILAENMDYLITENNFYLVMEA